MSNDALRRKAINLVRLLLYRERGTNVKRQQDAREKFEAFCTQHNLNYDHTLAGAKAWLNANSVAAVMNGLNTR